MLTRKRTATLQQGIQTLTVVLECPFFNEFVQPHGALNGDFEAHALWDYYGAALRTYEAAKKNFVYEGEPNKTWDVAQARGLFLAKANQHGVDPAKMVRYWPMIHQQRIMMGGKDQLPDQYQFHYWGH